LTTLLTLMIFRWGG